jgi:hypothetical protein
MEEEKCSEGLLDWEGGSMSGWRVCGGSWGFYTLVRASCSGQRAKLVARRGEWSSKKYTYHVRGEVQLYAAHDV